MTVHAGASRRLAAASLLAAALASSGAIRGEVRAGAAAEAEALVLDPETAAAMALERHPALEAERARVEQNRLRVREALGAAFPKIDAAASTVRSRDPGLLNSPNFSELVQDPAFDPAFLQPIPVTTYDYRLLLEQTVYAFGKVSIGIDAARANSRQVGLEFEGRELEIVRDAVVACYDLARADARAAVLASERASREREVRQAEDFLAIGAGTRLQVLQARAALAALRPQELGADGERAAARARLNAAVGRPALAPVAVAPDVLEAGPLAPLPSVEELAPAIEARADLRALAEERRVFELLGRIERTGHLPEIKLSGSYGFRAIDTANLTSRDYASWDAGLYLSWNLFDGGATRARVRQYRARTRQNAARERDRRATLTRDLVSAVDSYGRAREAVTAADEAVAVAVEAHRVATEEKTWGAATTLEVLEAERALTAARFQRLDALRGARVALADVRFLLGRLPGEPIEDAGETP